MMRWVLVIAALGAGCDDDGAFGAGADAALDQVGQICGGALSCPTGLTCVGNDQGAFFCMAHCPTPGALCADGTLCLDLVNEAGGACYVGGQTGAGAACDTTLSCAPRLRCVGGNERFCQPACAPGDDAACGEDARCVDFGDGLARCQDRIGARCSADADCADPDLVCQLGAPPWTPFAGSCTRACQVDADCSGDAVCLRTADGGICGDGCTRDGHCRAEEGFRCVTGTDCAGREDEAACQAMLGARRVCARL
ncbi:MAG: hypothetical protein R3F60_07885 [bacterium]